MFKYLGITAKMEEVFDTLATFLFSIFLLVDPTESAHIDMPVAIQTLIAIAYGGVIVSSTLATIYWIPKIRKTIKDDYFDSPKKYFLSPLKKFKKEKKT